MATLLGKDMTLPEAAYVAAVTERVINQEIEASVVKPRRMRAQRCLSPADVVYLTAVRALRSDIAPKLRRRLRAAIATAMRDDQPDAQVDSFQLPLKEVVGEVLDRFQELERSRERFIESRPEVLGGQPVIKGTRIAAHFVADLVKRGAERADVAEELDLDPEEIDAAVLFARVSPRRGRPGRRRLAVTEHVPADR